MVRQGARYCRRRQHGSQARTYASTACSQNKTCSSLHARNIRVTKFGKVLSHQRAEESQEGTSPILILGGRLTVCQVLMIVLGAVDLHQGCGKLEWDVHRCRTTQSRGLESEPYELKSDDTVVSHLIPSALSRRSC
jgi:hypothetical protein